MLHHVLAVAKTFSCSICDERNRVSPRRPATLEVIPKKWQVVQSDMGSWVHPYSKDKCKFILFVDEGCRFRAGKILFVNNRNMATWPLVKQVFEEHWLSHFGQPEVLRGDPEGVSKDTEAAEWCASRGIELSTIPAEAHWQIGIVENAIKGVKAVMSAMAEEFHDMSLNELFCRAVWVSNSKDNHRGYSPLQHAMGRSPDERVRSKTIPYIPKKWQMEALLRTSELWQSLNRSSLSFKLKQDWRELRRQATDP